MGRDGPKKKGLLEDAIDKKGVYTEMMADTGEWKKKIQAAVRS